MAAGRGLPEDSSEEVNRDWREDREHGAEATWINWSEIQRIDTKELSPGFDVGPTVYRRVVDAQGQVGGWTFESRLSREPGLNEYHPIEEERDGLLYRWERRTRGQVLRRTVAEQVVMGVFQALAEIYGPSRVRIVYWMWSA